LLFGSLVLLVRRLRKLVGGRLQAALRRALGKTALVGLAAGALTTVVIQSSSLTLSVLVPFAATNIVTLEQMFPIVLGANLGTTATALAAASAAPAETLHAAVQIALVHMLFNVIGTLAIYPLAGTRRLPLAMARWIANHAAASRIRAVGYVVLLFYGVPALGFVVWRALELGGAS
jgi:sodium-dependent phosphate cotransporter